MANNTLEIVLKLTDELSYGLMKAEQSLDKFHDNFKRIGKEISSVGQNLTFFGAGVVAPFVVAMKKASETNTELAKTFRQIDSVSNQFYQSISKSLIPVLQTFTGSLVSILSWWNSLSQATKDFIIQATFITGAFLSLGGILTIIIGKLISLSAGIAGAIGAFAGWAALNIPLLATVGIFVALVGLMFKFKGVADTVISTFEFLSRSLWNGLLTIKLAFEIAIKAIADGILNVVTMLSQIPGPSQKAFQGMIGHINEVRREMQGMIDKDMNGIITQSQKMGQILETGTGQWSLAFDNTKQHLMDFMNLFPKLQQLGQQTSTIVAHSFTEKFNSAKDAIGTLSASLSGAAAQNKKFAVAAQAVSIGLAVMNTAAGVTKALQQYGFPLGLVFGSIIAAAGAIQIATIASQSFAVGTPNVPSDMTAQIHKGETIIPATFADAIRRGDMSLGGPGGSSGGGDIQINIYGVTVNSKENIRELAEELGFEVDRKFRNARSRV